MRFISLIFLLLSFNAISQQTIDKLNVNQLKLPKESVSKALTLDATGQVKSSSSITDTELSYLDGLSDTLVNLLSGKANDNAVLKLTTDQSASGVKTFTGKIVASSTTNGSVPCPVMTETQRNAFTASQGDCVYNTTSLKLSIYDGSLWKDAGGSGGVSLWLTANPYLVNDVVIESNKIYRCLVAHTSGTFATDLAALRWVEVSASPSTPYSLSNGGTNSSLTAVNGGIVWVDADSFEILAAGTSGQVLQSNGAAAPSWVNKSISGKTDVSSSVTVEEIQVPNNQLTSTATNKHRLESGNTNILVNPSFEHSTFSTGWTNSAGTFAEDLVVEVDGLKAAKLTLSSQTVSLVQDSALYAAQFADGLQGSASVKIKSGVSGLSVCSRNAGVTSTNCAVVSNGNKWASYTVPFVLGGTSNGIAIISSGNVTGDVYVDDAYVGSTTGINNTAIITPWQPYTPTFTGFGTVTNIDMDWRQVGSNIEIRGSFQAGTISASATYAFSLPSSYIVASSVGTNEKLSSYAFGAVLANSTNYFNCATSGLSEVNFCAQNASVGYGKLTTNALMPANNTAFVVGTMTIPIANLAGSTQVFASQCGAACEDVMSAQVSSTGVVSNESINWINGDCTNASPAVCTFNTGIFTVAPNCTMTSTSAGNAEGATIPSTSTTASAQFSANVKRSFTINCQKQGADYTSSRTIVGSFLDGVKSIGSVSGSDIQMVMFGSGGTCTTVCSTGTCTICTQMGKKITSVTWNATGQYRINGIDGTKYSCVGSSPTANYLIGTSQKDVSTSSYVQMIFASGGTAANGQQNTAICVGDTE